MRRIFTLWLATTWLMVATPRAPESRPPEVSDPGATPSVALAKTPKKPAVSEVLVTPKPAGDVTIDVAMTKPATFQVYRFDNPDRLVVDVEGMTNAVRQQLIPVTSPIVMDVRVSQYRAEDPEVVRIVADLAGNPSFEAQSSEGGIRLDVKPRLTANTPVASAAGSTHETGVSSATPPKAESTPGASASPVAALKAALKQEAAENRTTAPVATAHEKALRPVATSATAVTQSASASHMATASESPALEMAAKRD